MRIFLVIPGWRLPARFTQRLAWMSKRRTSMKSITPPDTDLSGTEKREKILSRTLRSDWRYRTNNLPKTRCQPLQFPPTAPSWVQEIDAANRDGGQDQDNVSQDTSSNNRSQRPRFRLRSKTNAASSTSMPVHVSQASSSSTSMPVSGTLHNQTSCLFPRKGIG